MNLRKRLNLGCRTDYKNGWVNLDIDRDVKADVYWDLTKYPYPFKDNEFDDVLAHAILEHIPNPSKVLKELHRITKPGGLIYILVPHSSDPLKNSDWTHINFFNSQSFKPWSNKDLYPLFQVLKNKICFSRVNYTFMNKIINPIVNMFPTVYERLFTGLVQCSCIVFILRARKDSKFYEARVREMIRLDKRYGKKWTDNLKFIREV